MAEVQHSAEALAKLQQAFAGQVTPYDEITNLPQWGGGQYDWLVNKLEAGLSDKGLYVIHGEFTATAPAGFGTPFKRTLYIGSNKDPLAELPDTRKNNSTLRFLKNIAKVNSLPTNNMSDQAMCTSILGKAFGCRLEERKYKNAAGEERTGTDFGRNVTPAGMLPAKLDKPQVTEGAATANGHANGAAALPAGVGFGTE